MAAAIRSGQAVYNRAAASSTGNTITLPAAPIAGNLLVVCQGVDKVAGTFTTPTGFQTPIIAHSSTSVSLFMSWKVADGSETSVATAWSTVSPGGGGGRYLEIEDTAVTGTTWELLGSANNPTTEATAAAWSTGTTAAIAAAGFAVACATADTATNVASPQSWTNGFTVEFDDAGASGSGGGMYTATASPASSTAVETTMSHAGTVDQMSAAVGVWRKVAGGGGGAPGPSLMVVTSTASWRT